MPSFSLGICSKALIVTNTGPEVTPATTAPPSPCPFASQDSFLGPSQPSLPLAPRHRLALLWMLLPGLIPDLITSGISFPFLHEKWCLSCCILCAESGLSARFGENRVQAYLCFCLSINTCGVRRTHVRTCEQILTSSCFCVFIAISTALL